MFSKEHNAFKLAKIYTPGYKRERKIEMGKNCRKIDNGMI